MRPLLRSSLVAAGAFILCAANWTDRAEYDLVFALRSEAATPKRLALLDQWKAKYPNSPLRQERRELYLASYYLARDTVRMVDVVKEMLAERPDSLTGAYWCSVLVPGGPGSPELWSLCEKSARQFLAAQPPPSRDAALLARRVLGWIHWQRAEYPQAEAELTAYLRENPDSAEISAWLGAVLAFQKQPEKLTASLWRLAWAASRTGAGSLTESQQRQAAALLETVYTSYHGGADGLDDLRTASAKSPVPPDGFTVESAAAAAARRQQSLSAGQPDLAAWVAIRKRLEAPDGADYFAAELRDKPLPKLNGTLSRFSAPGKPEELLFGMENPAIEEVVVKLTAPLANDPTPGQQLEFEGIAVSFTAVPFVLVIRAEPAKVTGGR